MDIDTVISMLRTARQIEFRHWCEQFAALGEPLDVEQIQIARKEFSGDTDEAIKFLRTLQKEN